MAFIGAPQPWLSPSPSSTPPPPFNAFDYTNDDCALPLCSNKCPQFCLVLPPPPPFFFNNNPSYDYDDDDSSSNRISRLKVTFISVLSTAFLIIFFVHVISILRHRRQRHNNNRLFNPNHVDSLIPDQTQPETAATSGLENTAAENSRAAGGGANTMMA